MEALDKDVLGWIAEQTGDAALAAQINAAEVKRRDYMRTGWFVYLDTPADSPQVPAAVRPACPRIQSAELMDGAGCSLFLRNGRLHYLEIYARGGFFPQQLQHYELLAES